jgi:hypothetical protein
MMGVLERKGHLKKKAGPRAGSTAGGSSGGHGRGIRPACFQWIGKAAPSAPGRGIARFPARIGTNSEKLVQATKRKREGYERVMPSLPADNLLVRVVQTILLASTAGLLPILFRVRHGRAQLGSRHIILAACLLLPALPPWRHATIAATTSAGIETSADAAPATLSPAIPSSAPRRIQTLPPERVQPAPRRTGRGLRALA